MRERREKEDSEVGDYKENEGGFIDNIHSNAGYPSRPSRPTSILYTLRKKEPSPSVEIHSLEISKADRLSESSYKMHCKL